MTWRLAELREALLKIKAGAKPPIHASLTVLAVAEEALTHIGAQSEIIRLLKLDNDRLLADKTRNEHATENLREEVRAVKIANHEVADALLQQITITRDLREQMTRIEKGTLEFSDYVVGLTNG